MTTARNADTLANGHRRHPPVQMGSRRSAANYAWAVLIPFAAILQALPLGVGVSMAEVVGIAVVARAASIRTRGRRAYAVLGGVAMYLWVLASFASLLGVGFPRWALIAFATDIYVVVLGVAVFRFYCAHPYVVPAAGHVGAAVVGAVAAAVLIDSGPARATGIFENPNVPAHLLALTVVIAGHFLRNRAMKWSLWSLAYVGLLLAAVLRTGSMAALVMVTVGLLYVFYSSLRLRIGPLAAPLMVLALLAVLFYAALQNVSSVADLSAEQYVSGLTEERATRSTESRTRLWSELLATVPSHPLGAGPYGVAARGLAGGLEAHSDLLATLVERGPIGLAALLIGSVTLYRSGIRGGLLRAVIIAAASGGIFRETLHFRHLVVWLAFCAAYEVALGRRQGLSDR